MSDDIKDTIEESVEKTTEDNDAVEETVEDEVEETAEGEDEEELKEEDVVSPDSVEAEEVVPEYVHPDFRAGDTVKVFYKIIEAGKERIQPFEGIVISKRGSKESITFIVRRIGAQNVGIERIFPLKSPNIAKIEVLKRGKVRRAKLFYLRKKKGRAATRVKELKTTK